MIYVLGIILLFSLMFLCFYCNRYPLIRGSGPPEEDRLKSTIKKLKQKYDDDSIADLERLESMVDEYAEVEDNLMKSVEYGRQLQEKLSQCHQEKEQIVRSVSGQNREKDKRIKKLEDELIILNEEKKALGDKIDKLLFKLHNSDERKNKEISELNKNYENLNKEYVELQNQYNNIREQNVELRDLNKGLKESQELTERKYEEQNRRWNADFEKYVKENKRLEKIIDDLRRTINARDEDSKYMRTKLKDLENIEEEYNKQSREIKFLRDQNERLRRMNDELEERISTLEDEMPIPYKSTLASQLGIASPDQRYVNDMNLIARETNKYIEFCNQLNQLARR